MVVGECRKNAHVNVPGGIVFDHALKKSGNHYVLRRYAGLDQPDGQSLGGKRRLI
jgi:hypothetical protein